MIEVSARPYPFSLDPARTALVVIDMQRDFVECGGFGEALGNDVTKLQAIIPTVAALLALFRARGWPIRWSRRMCWSESSTACSKPCAPILAGVTWARAT